VQPIEGGNLVPVSNSGEEPLVVQQFTFYRTGVKSLALVGEFNSWDEHSTPMTEVSQGVWTVSVALRPGVYEYQFIVDGTKRETDPSMPKVESDFGSPNSVVTVSRKAPQ
jgi:1,4-alpha-glucan branching enzyme